MWIISNLTMRHKGIALYVEHGFSFESSFVTLRMKTWLSRWGLCLLRSVALPHRSRVFQHVLLELLIHCCLRIIYPPGTWLAALSVGKSWLNREKLNTEHKSESDLGKLSRLMTRSACAHKYRNTSVAGLEIRAPYVIQWTPTGWHCLSRHWQSCTVGVCVCGGGYGDSCMCVCVYLCLCVCWGAWRQLCDQPAEDRSWSALKAC